MGDRSQQDVDKLVGNILQKLKKKRTFKAGMIALRSVMRDSYASGSSYTQSRIFDAVCKAAKQLQTKYTRRSFWTFGQSLFSEAGELLTEPEHSEEIRSYQAMARSYLVGEADGEEVPPAMRAVELLTEPEHSEEIISHEAMADSSLVDEADGEEVPPVMRAGELLTEPEHLVDFRSYRFPRSDPVHEGNWEAAMRAGTSSRFLLDGRWSVEGQMPPQSAAC